MDKTDEAVTRLTKLGDELYNELLRFARISDAKDAKDATHLDQIERRVFIRSLFALIEGMAFGFKTLALELDALNPHGPRLTEGERYLAQEAHYQLKQDGNVRLAKAKLRTAENLPFAFRTYCKVRGIPAELNLKSEGWKTLIRSQAVRDRLMHPRNIDSLHVTDDEINESRATFNYFHGYVMELFDPGSSAKPIPATEIPNG